MDESGRKLKKAPEDAISIFLMRADTVNSYNFEKRTRRHLLKKYLGGKKNRTCKWLNVEGGGEYKRPLTLYFDPSMWFMNLLADTEKRDADH